MSAATRRHRGQQLEAEDATDLTLGDDFKDAIVLSLGEANVLLDKVLNPDDPDAKTEREALPENPIHKKTTAYLNQFARLKDPEVLTDLRATLETNPEADETEAHPAPLHTFEAAQLVNFCPDTVEEAKSLVPSLQSRSDDERLQGWLNEISTRRAFSQS